MSIPDDLDDTFLALRALHGYCPRVLDGAALEKVALLLAHTETAPGGPYWTWIVPRHAGVRWRDIDLVVNCNVGSLLKTCPFSGSEVILRRIAEFIEQEIASAKLASRYYSGNASIYFTAAYYRNGLKAKRIAEHLLRRRAMGAWDNPLQVALALTSLIDLGMEGMIEKSDLEVFIEAVRRRALRAYGFCLDPMRGGKAYYAGSPALTAAFFLQAMSKLRDGI